MGFLLSSMLALLQYARTTLALLLGLLDLRRCCSAQAGSHPQYGLVQ